MRRTEWWKHSVVYQVYPRSFCDGNGDGIGDLPGITSKLDYLKALGVDVIWLSPVYASPNDDNGYDISDYRAIMPEFGTLADFDTLLAGMHRRGMKLVMDLVVNHTSDEHAWFQQARTSRDNPYHDYYLWREPRRAPDGTGQPPTNWEAAFNGSAWEWNEATGEYYLHMFSRKQPDLNWENPRVRAEVYDLMRFWLDRGVDGFRMDVINMISKPWNADGSLPDAPVVREGFLQPAFAMTCNGPRLLEFLQEMRRAVLDSYDTLTVGEAPLVTPEHGRALTHPKTGALNMLFQFEHMDLDSVGGHVSGKWARQPLDLRALKATMARWQHALEGGQGWNSLYLANHDQPRAVSRFGDDGEHRVRSAQMLALWLHGHQGTPYVYQGEELGLPNVRFERIGQYRDIESINHYRVATTERGQAPEAVLADLRFKSRDNARTPMPWSAGPQAGFSAAPAPGAKGAPSSPAAPWIGLHPDAATLHAQAQEADAGSVLHFYRRLIALRRSEPLLVHGRFQELLSGHTEIAAYLRLPEGTAEGSGKEAPPREALLVLCNVSGRDAAFSLPDAVSCTGFDTVLSNLPPQPGESLRALTLRPWEGRLLRLHGGAWWAGPDEQAVRLWSQLSRELGRHAEWPPFEARLRAHLADLRNELAVLYGERTDFEAVVLRIVRTAFEAWCERSAELRTLDAAREAEPRWFESQKMVGGVCYADLFAGDLSGVEAQIPYFKELGLTYLHLMPPFLCPEPHNDGGYAVSSYRAVQPRLGRIEDLRRLAAALRREGISLVLDFVFNHTADEHGWARAAARGEAPFKDYYLIFPDRQQPDAYERTLREIFPDEHPGAFSQLADGRWVWTTFHSYQWDLNYANPEVFAAMAGEMLAIANLGVEFLRMDAVAFVWKRLGTPCENLPEAHALLKAYNALARMAAPSLLFKSEAIVHPDDVVKYISPGECQVSYNPLQMALLWNTLATREVNLLQLALAERHALPEGTAWVNYVRSHDDIGWTFADEDAARLGIQGFDHRQFLNRFYVNRHPGSFARGVPFQDNPASGDCRISGTCASLCGLEQGDPHGVARVLLLYGVALSSGGIPLIYLGDEVGTLNHHGYANEPGKADDSRWVHRPARDAARYAARHDPASEPGRIFAGMKRMIAVRGAHEAFAGGRLIPFHAKNASVLGYQRPTPRGPILVLANFGEAPQPVAPEVLAAMPGEAVDLLSGVRHALRQGLLLGPYQQLWLDCRGAPA